MAALTGRRDQLRRDLSHMLNPHFGSIFRSSHYPTILALSVMRYVGAGSIEARVQRGGTSA